MKNENDQYKMMLRNTKAKLMLNEVLIGYSKLILFEIELHPELLDELLDYFDMDKDEFFQKLNDGSENISFYDEALSRIRKRSNS